MRSYGREDHHRSAQDVESLGTKNGEWDFKKGVP